MVDNLTKEKRSKIMRSIISKNTKPELIVRRLLTTLGYRYRLHRKDLPGKPDIAFIGRKKAIFVHGCFWHVHVNCPISHIPESEFWKLKLAKNQNRDLLAITALSTNGWQSLVIWECELKKIEPITKKLEAFLNSK
jgi:DNA mismatch endonuclease, patch repair protein